MSLLKLKLLFIFHICLMLSNETLKQFVLLVSAHVSHWVSTLHATVSNHDVI